MKNLKKQILLSVVILTTLSMNSISFSMKETDYNGIDKIRILSEKYERIEFSQLLNEGKKAIFSTIDENELIFFLINGIDPNYKNKNNETALSFTLNKISKERNLDPRILNILIRKVNILLEYGAKFDTKSQNIYNSLDHEIKNQINYILYKTIETLFTFPLNKNLYKPDVRIKTQS